MYQPCRSPSTCFLPSLHPLCLWQVSTAVLLPYTALHAGLLLPAYYSLYLWQVSTAGLLPVPASAGLLLPAHNYLYPLCQWQVSTALLPLSGSHSTCSPLSILLSFLWSYPFDSSTLHLLQCNIVQWHSCLLRYDVADLRLYQLRRIVTLRSGGLCVLIYTASLLISLSTGE